ncbi:hypothetical protein AB835_00355 [Candidatus Endobugula sertula]|uniref:Uncharacterized protein n=1 Tax=Candidatus Endobugula sertula TaxID=62101 RepID=A0A1D2QTX9_9GAMM|nr:hypothetical protein AB835_00355 [Candidatus Endobugula sertula]
MQGGIQLIPNNPLLNEIEKDHYSAVNGGMFYSKIDSFDTVIKRLIVIEAKINKTNKPCKSIKKNHYF